RQEQRREIHLEKRQPRRRGDIEERAWRERNLAPHAGEREERRNRIRRAGVASRFLDDACDRLFASEADKRLRRQQPGERPVDRGRVAENRFGRRSETPALEMAVQLGVEPLTL